jgi:hypothetical protein
VAAGDGPDWLWFRQTGLQQDDGSFVILGDHGVLVGNIHAAPIATLMSLPEADRWLQTRLKQLRRRS